MSTKDWDEALEIQCDDCGGDGSVYEQDYREAEPCGVCNGKGSRLTLRGAALLSFIERWSANDNS